jgi:hypothetical protein
MKALLLACCVAFAAATTAREDDMQAQWVALASQGLDPRAAETLARVHGTGRQLLALRAYLRAGDAMGERWSWTDRQLAAYPTSAEGRTAASDIAAVEQAFGRANPGFRARANQMPRSLEVQIVHWNENPGVGAVAAQFERALSREFAGGSRVPESDRLREALTDWRPTVAAPLAAPGLSPHGQGRAFDFQIEQDGKIVAGCDVATAHRRWDQDGWTSRLHAAVLASGRPFTGPLQSPYEPWHYAYQPPAR